MAKPSEITVTFPDTLEGATEAVEAVLRIKLGHEKASATAAQAVAAPAASQTNAALVLYDSVDSASRTRELLKALDTTGRTPAELSTKFTPNPDGSPLTKAQVRAVYRNLKRKQNTLKKGGIL